MIRLNLRDEVLLVNRLVLSDSLSPRLKAAFQQMAQENDLNLDSDSTNPQRGDLWVGAIPRGGWGSDSKEIGRTQGFEAYLVLELLRRNTLPAYRQPELAGHYSEY